MNDGLLGGFALEAVKSYRNNDGWNIRVIQEVIKHRLLAKLEVAGGVHIAAIRCNDLKSKMPGSPPWCPGIRVEG